VEATGKGIKDVIPWTENEEKLFLVFSRASTPFSSRFPPYMFLFQPQVSFPFLNNLLVSKLLQCWTLLLHDMYFVKVLLKNYIQIISITLYFGNLLIFGKPQRKKKWPVLLELDNRELWSAYSKSKAINCMWWG